MRAFLTTQSVFADACDQIVPFAVENRCWNSVALHHLAYKSLRNRFPSLGSPMICNAIRKVHFSYKALKIKKSQGVPSIKFNQIGEIREAELIRKGERWFFNLVLEIPATKAVEDGTILAVDVGENNLATTSKSMIYGGAKLRHQREIFLNRRRKPQSNGSASVKRCLQRISGKERRRVKETNHIVSKAIVEEACEIGAKVIILEDLTNIPKRIKGNKRIRSRLHRWSWHEMQQFIAYKAEARGISVVYVNPAYTSQTCSVCDSLGSRHKHRFKCSNCGSYQRSDRNAAINLLKLGESVVSPTAFVNMPMVAAM